MVVSSSFFQQRKIRNHLKTEQLYLNGIFKVPKVASNI